MLREFSIKTTSRNEFVNITSLVEKAASESKVKNGLCVVYCPHTTAGIVVNENAGPNVKSDLLAALEKIVPEINFQHSEGNSDAHLKSTLVGCEKVFVINNGELVLGTWQGIYFSEFDGPRNREVIVKVSSD